jgi:Protein of unknown function (DUF1573)
MDERSKETSNNKKYLMSIVIGFFIFGAVSGIFAYSFVTREESTAPTGNTEPIENVSYDEIYEMFACPCCGKPIDSNCCVLAVERKNYADGLIDSGIGKEKVIDAYVKKYGMNSFRNESAREEYRNYLIENVPKDRPIIEMSPREIDLGNVSRGLYLQNTTFNIKNTGNVDLVIDKLETSCGCTSAYLTIKGVNSPTFGHSMVKESYPIPEGWQVSLSPGETGTLTAEYNTTFHPGVEGLGPATRVTTIFSNDPIEPDAEVRILLNQVD